MKVTRISMTILTSKSSLGVPAALAGAGKRERGKRAKKRS